MVITVQDVKPDFIRKIQSAVLNAPRTAETEYVVLPMEHARKSVKIAGLGITVIFHALRHVLNVCRQIHLHVLYVYLVFMELYAKTTVV